jgi:hypothetical protein
MIAYRLSHSCASVVRKVSSILQRSVDVSKAKFLAFPSSVQ